MAPVVKSRPGRMRSGGQHRLSASNDYAAFRCSTVCPPATGQARSGGAVTPEPSSRRSDCSGSRLRRAVSRWARASPSDNLCCTQHSNPDAYLSELVVDPGVQHQGIGTPVARAVENSKSAAGSVGPPVFLAGGDVALDGRKRAASSAEPFRHRLVFSGKVVNSVPQMEWSQKNHAVCQIRHHTGR